MWLGLVSPRAALGPKLPMGSARVRLSCSTGTGESCCRLRPARLAETRRLASPSSFPETETVGEHAHG